MPIETRTVSIPNGSPGLSGYLAQPSGDQVHPGIVVIHEIHGLTDAIKANAELIAEEGGYTALAVDLFVGRHQDLCIVRFMSQLRFSFNMLAHSYDHPGITDVRAALTYLSTLPNVDRTRLGAIGFCMGGNFAICCACTDKRLKVIAPFYAFNPIPIKKVARSCPIVGSYPKDDITAPFGRKLDSKLNDYDVKHDIKIYRGAKHSFFYGGRNENKQAASKAWARTLDFFREEIG